MARSDFSKTLALLLLFLPVAFSILAGDAKTSGYVPGTLGGEKIPANGATENRQDLVFEHFTVEQGLSDNSVWAILQDRRGFMWFGTANGLNKFDGYHFTVYKRNQPDSNSLQWTNVAGLYEDNSGSLWLRGPGRGITRFNSGTEKSTTYLENVPVGDLFEDASGNLWFATFGKGLNKLELTSGAFSRHRLSSDTLNCICADSSGTGTVLWIGGAGGVDRFDPAKGTFTHVERSTGRHVTAIYKDRAGTLWIGTKEGLYTFEEATGTLWRCPIARWRPTYSHLDCVHSFYEDRKGVLWIGAGEELFTFERATGTFRQFQTGIFPIPSPSRVVHQVYEDRTGSLWLRTLGKGLSRLDSANNIIVSYVHDPNNPSSLSDNVVNEVYEARSGALWIGTAWGGVDKVDRARKAFRHYEQNPVYPWSLIHNTVHWICEDMSGQLWVATRGGLERFDRKTGKFTHFQHDPMDPHSLSSDIVRTVLEDHEGTIWVGTEVCGLNRLDIVRGHGRGMSRMRFRHYTHDPGNPVSIGSNRIQSLFVDRSGNIWIGTADAGLDQFSRDSGIFVHYRFDPSDPNSLGANWVNAICEDNNGRLWVGTGGGTLGDLSRLNRATGKFVHFKNDPKNPKSMGPGTVHSIYEDRGGMLWIGTTWGLNRFEPSTETFTQIDAPWGSVGDLVTGILEDSSGCLWLKTNKGVLKFNPRTGTFKTFDRSDGVPISPTWWKACCQSRNGEMFFGGINGFVRFHPDSIRDNPYVPPVVITAFRKSDKPVSLDTVISEKKVLHLSYHDNAISFEFVALNYTSPEKNQYAYKLEGFDEDWIYCGTRRYASYTNLDEGSYVFRVKGSNNDGVWNEEGTSIAVIITPPWWRTTWAYFGYGAAIVMLLYGLRRYDRKRTLLKHQLQMKDFEAEKLREVDAMKMRFFANISHEFRTPLTLILGPAEKLLSKFGESEVRDDLNSIQRSARRLLELINQLLDISKLDAGKMKMQVRAMDLVSFLKGLVFSFASLAERKHISLKFQTDKENITGYVDRDKLQKIVTNLLSNAFKFAPEGGEVRVGVSVAGGAVEGSQRQKHPERREGFVEIAVSDTGVGIPMEKLEKIFHRFYQVDDSRVREHEGAGIGLALTRELVEMHHGHISVTSDPGKGSTFRVRLPLEKEQWKEEDILEEAESTKEPPVPVTVSFQGAFEDKEPGEAGEREPELAEAVGEDWPFVLIVEDNADVRSYIRSYMTRQYRVEEAVHGLAGLEAATERMPDLVVSDIMMPKMDGVELCRRLKTDERTSHIPVILLTARASDEGKLEGLETGADDYIIKPFDVKELQVRIKNLIELRKTLREKYLRHCVLGTQEIPIESMDERFLRKALEVVQEKMSEPGFGTATFAQSVCMSRMQLYRKLHSLTGRTPHEFIRNIRLQQAAKLLEGHWGNVAEVAFEVGFSSLSNFSRAFREEYGMLPSEYRKQHAQRSPHWSMGDHSADA